MASKQCFNDKYLKKNACIYVIGVANLWARITNECKHRFPTNNDDSTVFTTRTINIGYKHIGLKYETFIF